MYIYMRHHHYQSTTHVPVHLPTQGYLSQRVSTSLNRNCPNPVTVTLPSYSILVPCQPFVLLRECQVVCMYSCAYISWVVGMAWMADEHGMASVAWHGDEMGMR